MIQEAVVLENSEQEMLSLENEILGNLDFDINHPQNLQFHSTSQVKRSSS